PRPDRQRSRQPAAPIAVLRYGPHSVSHSNVDLKRQARAPTACRHSDASPGIFVFSTNACDANRAWRELHTVGFNGSLGNLLNLLRNGFERAGALRSRSSLNLL